MKRTNTVGGTVCSVARKHLVILGQDQKFYYAAWDECKFLNKSDFREGKLVTVYFELEDEFKVGRITAVLIDGEERVLPILLGGVASAS